LTPELLEARAAKSFFNIGEVLRARGDIVEARRLYEKAAAHGDINAIDKIRQIY